MSNPQKTDVLHIEYMPLDQLMRWPGNPKEHADHVIAESIQRFGVRNPLAIDERTGRLVAGHGRLTVLERAHAAGSPLPRFVQMRTDGMWMIPVTRGGEFADETEAAAYLVVDNRAAELGGWDDALLAPFLQQIQLSSADLLELTGFGETDLEHLLASVSSDLPDSFRQVDESIAQGCDDDAPQPRTCPHCGGDLSA